MSPDRQQVVTGGESVASNGHASGPENAITDLVVPGRWPRQYGRSELPQGKRGAERGYIEAWAESGCPRRAESPQLSEAIIIARGCGERLS